MEFLSSSYMPHGHCYLWQPNLLISHVASDLVIAGSYFSIPIAIMWFLKKRPDIEFKGVFYLFAAFILMCGITHLYSVYVVWVGTYGVQAILKASTALISLITAMAVFLYLPRALAIPSRAQWEQLKQDALEKRQQSESQSLFYTLTENLSTGLLVADRQLNILLANTTANRIFADTSQSLVDQNIAQFIPSHIQHHNALAEQFFNMPNELQHPMAKGRTVQAKRCDGEAIDVQIKLSQFQFFQQDLVAIAVDAEGITNSQKQEQGYQRTMRSLNSVNDGAWEWNIKTNEVWWNSQHALLIGVDSQIPASFDLWAAHVHPDERERVLNYLQATVDKRSDYNIEYLGRTGDGSYQWFHSRGKVYVENGEPVYMTGMLSNVQSTHELKQELSQKTDFLNRIINLSVAGLYVFDFKLNKNTYINDTYEHILGYTLDELNQIENLLSLFHPDEVEMVLAHMADVQATPSQNHELVYRFKHKQGHWVWCLSQDSINEVDEKGQPLSMLGTFIDISELKQKEQSIQEWATSFYSIFNQAAVGIAQVALDGSFLKINQRACEMFGYDERKLLSLSFQDITHPEDLAIDMHKVQELLDKKADSYTLEKRYISSAGRVFWALLTVKIVRNADDQPLYFISVIEDIEAIKETERALHESNQALEAFAFTASHDLQEPLRKIQTFAGLIDSRLKDKFDEPEARYELTRLTDAAQRMSRLIANILELARVSKQPLNLANINLQDAVNIAISSLGLTASDNRLTVKVKRNPVIQADPEQLSRVFQNLFSNALKYQIKPNDSVIEIEYQDDQDFHQISVTDNGPGIEAEQAEVIFAPFKRLVGREVEGSGMGLAICRQIINRHGGAIMVDSQVNTGLKVLFRLPKIEDL